LDIENQMGKNLDTPDLGALAADVDKFLEKHASIRLPYRADIRLLRQARNLVQHGVSDPRGDLKRFSTITSRFFERLVVQVFGLQPDAIQVSSIIENHEVAGCLREAEEKMASGAYLEAIVALRDAFDNAALEQRIKMRTYTDSTCASMELSPQSPVVKSFIQEVSRDLFLLTTSIDISRYHRFREYVEHIPTQYRADLDRPHIVMQRPWEESDALYCYGFVADTLLSWQNAPKERLYPLKTDREYRYDEYIDGQAIEVEPLYMTWSFEGGEIFKVYAVKAPSCDVLRALEKGKTYNFLTRHFVDGIQETEGQEKLEVLDIRSQLITHRPPRWEVGLRLRRKPSS
jgi:hypothetical protein